MSENEITLPPVLEEMIFEYAVRVLVEDPEDIISHAADYFTHLRDNRDNDRPTGLIGERNDLSGLLGSRVVRRSAVSGDQYDPEHDDKKIENFPKTDEERERIIERIKDIFLFKVLDEEEVNEVVDAMSPKEVFEGEVFIHQDALDENSFYVVDRGTYQASVKNENGEEIVVQTYDNSGSFGELALLYKQPRAASVKAATNGLLWEITGETLNRLVVKRAFDKRQKYMALLEKVPELQLLTEYEKMQVCDGLMPVLLKKGETVFEEGDEGDGMYFVEDGKIRILHRSAKNKEEQDMAWLGPGEYFGEMALVKKQPRAATARAMTDTKLAFLDVKAFERLLGPYSDTFNPRMDTYEMA